ncbi:MAG: hypothetical protein ABII10_01735 [Candidatus Paceibacterota bacterium]
MIELPEISKEEQKKRKAEYKKFGRVPVKAADLYIWYKKNC